MIANKEKASSCTNAAVAWSGIFEEQLLKRRGSWHGTRHVQ